MQELKQEDVEKMKRDDVRAEYNAIVSYHTSLVVARFTIAGLLTGGSAFLAAAALSPDRPNELKVLCGVFAAWLTLCVWMLDLRSRGLYRNIALRGIQIEREHWKLTGKRWYEGFLSRQYKTEPPADYVGEPTPQRPEPDDTTVFGRPLPKQFSKWISHSTGFDLLYAGAMVLWALVSIFYGYKVVFTNSCQP